jgi:hypothetical protein
VPFPTRRRPFSHKSLSPARFRLTLARGTSSKAVQGSKQTFSEARLTAPPHLSLLHDRFSHRQAIHKTPRRLSQRSLSSPKRRCPSHSLPVHSEQRQTHQWQGIGKASQPIVEAYSRR